MIKTKKKKKKIEQNCLVTISRPAITVLRVPSQQVNNICLLCCQYLSNVPNTAEVHN